MPPRAYLRNGARAGAAAWAGGLLWLTLHGVSTQRGGSPWVWAGAENVLADVVANVAAFVPLGALLVGAGTSAPRAGLLAFVLSAFIEVVQGLGVPGRYAAASDLAANTAGGIAGAWLAVRAGVLWNPGRERATRYIAAWCAIIIAIVVGTTWLQAPGAPSDAYEGQHADLWHAGQDEAHAVQVARFNGRPYAWGPMPDAAAVSRALRDDSLSLEVRIVPGPVASGVHRIAAVIANDASKASLVRLETAGTDLRFAVRVRAAAWGLHAPYVRLDHAWPDPAARSGPIELGGARVGRRLSAWVRASDGARRSTVLTLTPLDGWMFIAPPVITSRVPVAVWRAVFVLLLAAPLLRWGLSVRVRSAQ